MDYAQVADVSYVTSQLLLFEAAIPSGAVEMYTPAPTTPQTPAPTTPLPVELPAPSKELLNKYKEERSQLQLKDFYYEKLLWKKTKESEWCKKDDYKQLLVNYKEAASKVYNERSIKYLMISGISFAIVVLIYVILNFTTVPYLYYMPRLTWTGLLLGAFLILFFAHFIYTLALKNAAFETEWAEIQGLAQENTKGQVSRGRPIGGTDQDTYDRFLAELKCLNEIVESDEKNARFVLS